MQQQSVAVGVLRGSLGGLGDDVKEFALFGTYHVRNGSGATSAATFAARPLYLRELPTLLHCSGRQPWANCGLSQGTDLLFTDRAGRSPVLGLQV
jgi:hypothetical protein